jgi:hypothetical protein
MLPCTFPFPLPTSPIGPSYQHSTPTVTPLLLYVEIFRVIEFKTNHCRATKINITDSGKYYVILKFFINSVSPVGTSEHTDIYKYNLWSFG